MADGNNNEIHQPTERADVDRNDTSKQQRARKFKDGKKLRKKNSQGLFVHDVEVVSAEYDTVNHHWLYKLLDYKRDAIDGDTKETDLGT